MVFANPIEEGWATGAYYDALAAPYYLSADKVESDYSPVRFQRELRLFRKFCKRGSVLDVGCSTGAFLYQLKTSYGDDYVVTGIDVAGPALDYAQRKGVPVVRESFLEMAHQEKQFSAITFWAVIEHLADPGRFLAKAASLLEPSGYCFVLVPNFHSLAVRLLGAKYRYIFPQHVNYFTSSTLARFTEGAPNLDIVHAGTMHFNPLVVWQDWRGNGAFVADEARARLLKRTTGYKQNPALKPLKFALACGEAVLGRLKLADNIVLVLQKSEPRRTSQLGDT